MPEPGVSIAAVALAHGLNANLLRRWMHEREGVSTQPRWPALEGPPVPDSTQSFVEPSRYAADVLIE